ncbi:hypothetical protein ABTZ59_22790 [Streptomyces sp. NPDC094034]|uniref:hypothetical protein n=1 Tax=Streptomyces sp. NPDC094034 TaxID=3155309 RepID=UPI003317CBC9
MPAPSVGGRTVPVPAAKCRLSYLALDIMREHGFLRNLFDHGQPVRDGASGRTGAVEVVTGTTGAGS